VIPLRCLFSAALFLCVSVLLTGCAGTVQDPQVGSISIFDPFSSVSAGGSPVSLTAVVEPSGGGVTWTLTLANVGCSPGCGTLTVLNPLSAVYTPPKTVPQNQSATITVTSQSDSKDVYAFDFTITQPISVTITNKFSSVDAGGPAVTVNATVANDLTGAGVSWMLTAGGSNCSPSCGTLTASPAPTFTATYTPPSTLPTGASASPTITAASVASPSAQDSFSFSINSSSSLFAKGSYAFLLKGYDGGGLPMVMAGSLTSNGQGDITAGDIDIDDDEGITAVPSPVTGTYTIDTSFNGVAHGTITITSYTFPNSSVNISFRFVLSADGTRGRIVELDGSGYINSGTIQRQDATSLSAANPAGNYAFLLDSDAPVGGRVVEVGQLVVGASGAVTGGLVDQSQAGAANPIYTAAAASGGPSTSPDASGRGTFTVTVNGNASQYAYYIVNSNQLNLIEIDRGLMFGTAQAGTAELQQALTADSVNTNPVSILELDGMDVVPNSNNIGPDVLIGAMTISGGSTFALTFDENDLGTIFSAHGAGGSVASFDPTTGRGTLSLSCGFNCGFVNSAVFYLYGNGEGFLIDTDPTTTVASPQNATTNVAFSGTFVPQSGGPFSSSSITGNLLAGSGSAAIPAVPDFAGAFNFNTTGSSFTALVDMTTLASQQGNLPGQSLTGTYSMADASLGRGTAIVPGFLFGYFGSTQPFPASFYMIAPNQFVMIGSQPFSDIGQAFYSGISFFGPQ
jgi:hypothetical protein